MDDLGAHVLHTGVQYSYFHFREKKYILLTSSRKRASESKNTLASLVRRRNCCAGPFGFFAWEL